MLKFTVITVTYNAENTIERTLYSVSNQDYDAVEHLIIDGCSEDGTMEAIHHYVERNTNMCHKHQIRLIREPDNGLYDAMNKGILQAKGDYLIFLNAGDTFHDSQVLTDISDQVMRYNEARRPVVFYGETNLVDIEGNYLRPRRLKAPEYLTSYSFLKGMLVCHQSFYVRTDIARNVLYDLKYRFSADYDWCVRIIRQAERRGLALHNTHLILTDYLSEGMTTHNRRSSLCERYHIMAHHYGTFLAVVMHIWFVPRSLFLK